jgi:hypothetical protein
MIPRWSRGSGYPSMVWVFPAPVCQRGKRHVLVSFYAAFMLVSTTRMQRVLFPGLGCHRRRKNMLVSAARTPKIHGFVLQGVGNDAALVRRVRVQTLNRITLAAFNLDFMSW